MSKFKRPNIKDMVGRSTVDKKTIDFKSINVQDFAGKQPIIEFLNDFSVKSFNIEEEHFTNFICDDRMFPDDISDAIYTDVDKLLSINSRYLDNLKRSAMKCLISEKSEEVLPNNPKRNRDIRFQRILSTVNQEALDYYNEGALYKYKPRDTNLSSTTGFRVYFAFRVVEGKEGIEYYHSIVLIDLYHLAIPSKYNGLTHDEYKIQYYNAICHSSKDLQDFFYS